MKRSGICAVAAVLASAIIFTGCGKKDETSKSNAVSVTPTPTEEIEQTVLSDDSDEDTTESTAPSTQLTGTIISASMNDLVLRTADGKEYACSTLNAVKDLEVGVTIGATVTVTLESTESTDNMFTATRVSDSDVTDIDLNSNTDNSDSDSGSDSDSDNDSGYNDYNSDDSGYDSDSDYYSYDSDYDSGYYDSGYDDYDSGYYDSDSDYYGRYR